MTDSKKLDLILDKLDKVDIKFGEIDARFEKIDARLDKMESRLDKMESRLEKIDARLDKMESRLDKMESRLDKMESRLDGLDSMMNDMKDDIRSIELTIENELRVSIQRVAEGHLDLSRNLHEAMKPSNEVEMLSVRVGVLESDVRELKKRIS